MTEAEFHAVYGSEVAGNHTSLGIPSDGVGELCEWTANDGTRFYWITADARLTFGAFLTRCEMRAELLSALPYDLQCEMHESGELDMDRESE